MTGERRYAISLEYLNLPVHSLRQLLRSKYAQSFEIGQDRMRT